MMFTNNANYQNAEKTAGAYKNEGLTPTNRNIFLEMDKPIQGIIGAPALEKPFDLETYARQVEEKLKRSRDEMGMTQSRNNNNTADLSLL